MARYAYLADALVNSTKYELFLLNKCVCTADASDVTRFSMVAEYSKPENIIDRRGLYNLSQCSFISISNEQY